MSKLTSWKNLGILAITVIAFVTSIIFAHSPTEARTSQYQELIEQGVIAGIVEPEELGLSYLRREPVELAADSSLIEPIYVAERDLSVMPEDIPLLFPGGSNSPIAMGQIPDDTGTPGAATGVPYVGFINKNGQANNFTPGVLEPMFNDERRNGGNLTFNSETQNILVADASGSFLQARRIPVLDLIVINPRDGRPYVIRRVNANAVCRDGVNSVHNGTLRRL